MYATTLGDTTPVHPLRIRPAPVEQCRTEEVHMVRRIRTGEELAFRELVECYKAKSYRIAYGILHNPEDADEIAQETFAKVYFSIKSFDGRSSLLTWIHRIAVNECYSYLRKRRLKFVYESDSPDGPLPLRMQMLPDARPTHDETVAQRDFLNKLLERIPAEDRLLLLFKEVEGLSTAKLSELTGTNENTIKSRLVRARRKLIDGAARLNPRTATRRLISRGSAR
jgi:RNA polymerase sigma-70 factor, ECF subfamily